jgi:acetolactate synthase I/II/III large subunit
MTRTGGRVLVDQLVIHGVDTVFCVPGESYVAALDSLGEARDAIRLVVCRQEGGASFMAEAYGKLTGRPGVCFVTRGPGATNASIGVHTAFQDSTPMVLLVGQVARDALEREAFQEVDFRQMFGPLAKWVAQIDDPRRIPELVSRAFTVAASGRPGPVVLALPEDVLHDECETPDAGPYTVVRAHAGAADLAAMRTLLAEAKRPLAIVGGGGWTSDASADLLAFADRNGIPVAAAFRCQDYVDNRSAVYVGDVGLAINPKLAQRVRDADVLLAIGPRLGEATTSGYTLVEIPRPRQRLVHVHPGPEELGRVYQPALAINSGLPQFCAAVRALEPVNGSQWAAWAADARADYEEWIRPLPGPGGLNISEVVTWLRKRLPSDSIVTNGAGNFTVWAHRFYQFGEYRTQLGPTSGAMGYGVPAAVAAKLLHPERIVVCLTGDGDFLMNGQELATAVQNEAAIVVLLVNNGMYGTIRMHQERAYPGRPYGTDLVNPDFAAYARAFGGYGDVVERTADFAASFERALEAGVPALLELRVDPEALTPSSSLSEIREAARR